MQVADAEGRTEWVGLGVEDGGELLVVGLVVAVAVVVVGAVVGESLGAELLVLGEALGLWLCGELLAGPPLCGCGLSVASGEVVRVGGPVVSLVTDGDGVEPAGSPPDSAAIDSIASAAARAARPIP